MSHALVTIIAPLALENVERAEAAIDKLSNPATATIKTALDVLDSEGCGVHFTSLHAIRSQDGKRGHIVFEFSADGEEDAALAAIVSKIENDLRPVFLLASDWSGSSGLLPYLDKHRVVVGCGWFSNPGAVFAGTPGLTVSRIRDEADLATEVTKLVGAQPAWMTALDRVGEVRESLKAKSKYNPKFEDALKPATALQPFEQPPLVSFIPYLIGSFAKTYLWPLLPVIVAVTVGWALWGWWQPAPGQGLLRALLQGAWDGLQHAVLWSVVILLVVALIGYLRFRAAEATDSLEERAPPHDTLAGMFERENQNDHTQNHMISVTQRKPGLIRKFTSRLVFWFVREFATHYYRPGFLSDIGTIHFARWVTAPNSPDVIFLSNYGGSWESYLEDFITRAHAGLTAVWSNSVGFPRSENLFQRGATDGERFKRYARQSMVPTRFWYSAYPQLTTAVIRNNAEIRRGLSGSMTEDEAMRWLSLFGSAPRPASKLLGSEIQSLMFGGLNFMPHGTCVLYDLPANDVPQARKWLADVLPKVAFNDGRRFLSKEAVLTLALGARGLLRLGLPKEGLATFPFAFVEGMTTDARTRILNDVGNNAVAKWDWGRTQPDVALLIYGKTPADVATLQATIDAAAKAAGMVRHYEIPLKEVTNSKEEAFGFVDGISQPVIRDTYKSLRNPDPIHLVEPGEFILGYPDNRGNVPPGPTLSALHDPDNRLPLVGGGGNFAGTVVERDRDLGFSGSFLVIRQLEQDVAGFDKYCNEQAQKFAKVLPDPYNVTADFIAAKIVGRWRDGSSLARYPYEPESSPKNTTNATSRPQSNPANEAAIAAAPPKPARVANNTIALEGVTRAAATPNLRQHADNDFLFGTEDPEGLRCPFGAHIRRANPRDSLMPGSADQVAITNRHRILRVGRQYDDGQKKGLLFMCLNGDLERQFEFIQQTWLMSPSFHGLSCEKDPLLGDGAANGCAFTIPTRYGPLALEPLQHFITTKGGGYFFMPGKRLIEYLSVP